MTQAQPREGTAKPKGERWGDGRTVQDPRKEPARGAPYNWPQMGLAAIMMALMLAFLIWLIRRQTR